MDEQQWKDDDFLSFEPLGNDDEDRNEEGASSSYNDSRSKTLESNETAPGELPPWMVEPFSSVPRSFPRYGSSYAKRGWDQRRNINPLVQLHNEIVSFVRLMEPTAEEIRTRQELIEKFRIIVSSVFGPDKCNMEVFGSQATGLFLPSSDIDIVVHTGAEKEEKGQCRGGKSDENANGSSSNSLPSTTTTKEEDRRAMDSYSFDGKRVSKKDGANGGDSGEHETNSNERDVTNPLQSLASAVRAEWIDDLSYLEVIENTRVPLVKFTYKGISVDVSFDQDRATDAASLMKTYLKALPPLRPLTFVLKYFMEARGINKPYSGGVGSFLLQLMIVSFLQHRERDAHNFRRPSLYNLGALLVEFLELYGTNFNYVTTGISVRYDGFYFSKGARDKKTHFWHQDRPFLLAMENPFDVTFDVGQSSFRIQVVQRAFETAYKVLLAHVSDPIVPAKSILGTILPVTSEMKERKVVSTIDQHSSRAGDKHEGRHSSNHEPKRKRHRRK